MKIDGQRLAINFPSGEFELKSEKVSAEAKQTDRCATINCAVNIAVGVGLAVARARRTN